MKDILNSFFEKEKIEYYSVLDYSRIREINPSLAARMGFVPKSAILFLIPYYSGRCDNISIYSASYDYHLIIKEITERLIDLLKRHFPEGSFRGFGDHSPIDERSAALISGLGILGDNGLLINEKYGSFVFIADVISDLPPELLGETPVGEIAFCHHCGGCKSACPTGVLKGVGSDCLSAITQRKGELTDSEAELMRKYGTAWGCDICQTVCPYKKAPRVTPIEFFKKDRIERLTKEIIDSMTDEQFKKRAFAWRGRGVPLRNLEILNKSREKE